MNGSGASDRRVLDLLLSKYKTAKKEYLQNKICNSTENFKPLLSFEKEAEKCAAKNNLTEAQYIVNAQLEERFVIKLRERLKIKPRSLGNSHLRSVLMNLDHSYLQKKDASHQPLEIFSCKNDTLNIKIIPLLLEAVLEKREEIVEGLIDDLLGAESFKLAKIYKTKTII